MAGRHVVCSVGELPPGARRIVSLEGREIGIFNLEGSYYAVRNVCPHHGAPLCLGEVGGTMAPSRPHEYVFDEARVVVRCPWHGYEFDLESGRAVYDPDDLRVRVYPVTVEDGSVVLHV
jgi:3-phenylpropionate/trans-cinnamate dioxygenase ferredoxin subunit